MKYIQTFPSAENKAKVECSLFTTNVYFIN